MAPGTIRGKRASPINPRKKFPFSHRHRLLFSPLFITREYQSPKQTTLPEALVIRNEKAAT